MALEFKPNADYPDLYWHGERLTCIGRGAYKRAFSFSRLDIVIKLGFTYHVDRDIESLRVASEYFDVAAPLDVWTFVDFDDGARWTAFAQQKLSIGCRSFKSASAWNRRYRRGDYGINVPVGDLKDINVGVDKQGVVLVHDCELIDNEAPAPLWYSMYCDPCFVLNGGLTVSEMIDCGWELVGGTDD